MKDKNLSGAETSVVVQEAEVVAEPDLEITADIASVPRRSTRPQGTSLNSLYDLSLPVTVELGRTEMTIDDVLQLGRGSVIELERLAGEPVDIYVGDRRFAEAEVVVVGENFGVRITRLLVSFGADEA